MVAKDDEPPLDAPTWGLRHAPSGSSRHSSTVRGTWIEPGTIPPLRRAPVDRMSTISPPSPTAARASAGDSRLIRARASARSSSSVRLPSLKRTSLRSHGAPPPRPARAPAAAVLRDAAARGSPRLRPAGRMSSTSAAATRRSARRRTWSRRCARLPRGPDVHGYAPFRGLPRLREAIAARYRDVYGVELDPEREVALVPGTKTAIVELACALPSAATRSCCPTRTTRTTVRGRARRRRDRPAAARPRCRLGARPRRGARRPLPSSSTTRRTRARSARRPGRSRRPSPMRAHGRARSSTTPRTSTSSSTAARRESFLATPGGEGRRRRDVDDVEDATAWRAGGSASSSATPRSSSA